MKNRGYTLLEVLGVIVILSVLTMIVFPSVINFIKKSSDEIDEYSMQLISNAADLYVKARKDSYIEYNDNKYIIEIQDLIDEGNLPESIKKSDIENIKDKCIQVEYKGYKFNYELKDKGACEQIIKLESICTLASDSKKTGYEPGAKYKCKVDPNRDSYTFYVLTGPTDYTVDLIMDQNINSDGTPAGERGKIQLAYPTKYNLVAWYSESNTNTKGPITAMQFLYTATKSWTNIEPLNYEYKDREYQNITTEGIGYTSFISTNGIATINSLSGTATIIGTVEEPLRARMPYNSDVSEKSNTYLDENISGDIYGYWTMSSYSEILGNKALARFVSGIGSYEVGNATVIGVRPVITLPVKNRIPEEYQEVEYIEGTGTQAIDTDFVPNQDTSVEMDFILTTIPTSNANSVALFGEWKNTNVYTVRFFPDTTTFFYGTQVNATLKPVNLDTINRHIIKTEKNKLYYDGVLVETKTEEEFTGDQTLSLLAQHGTSSFSRIASAKVYGCKIWDNGVLVRDYIPSYRKSDNEIGMYDMVTGNFYTNKGTGTFIKGADI